MPSNVMPGADVVPAITVFGAIALDCRLTARQALSPATSNPATAREAPGGVGRNMAVALAGLGAAVRLVSRIGDDAAGRLLLDDLGRLGVDAGCIAHSAGLPTARYWAVLEPSGELALGLADMAVLDELTPDGLEPATALPADAWLLDLNLPEACVDHLLGHPARPPVLAVDTVSARKAEKLRGRLRAIDLLFTNAAEAAVLADRAESAALVALGAGKVVMGLGAAGLEVADGDRITRLEAQALPGRRARPDVTGAGDALAAGTLWASLRGLELATAARLGRLAASLVITESAPPTLSGLQTLAALVDKPLHEELDRLLA